MYAETWMLEDLQWEVMHIQEQVWELQELANEYENSQNFREITLCWRMSSPRNKDFTEFANFMKNSV